MYVWWSIWPFVDYLFIWSSRNPLPWIEKLLCFMFCLCQRHKQLQASPITSSCLTLALHCYSLWSNLLRICEQDQCMCVWVSKSKQLLCQLHHNITASVVSAHWELVLSPAPPKALESMNNVHNYVWICRTVFLNSHSPPYIPTLPSFPSTSLPPPLFPPTAPSHAH